MKPTTNRRQSKNQSKRLRPQICLLAATLMLLAQQTGFDRALAAQPQDEIGKIEKRLFFRQYSEEDVPARLKRIENQIFGEAYSDSVTDRLARISAALPVQAPEPEAGPRLPDTPAASVPPSNDTVAPAKTQPEDDEDAAEKRRIAALQARDEEVARMLQEGVALWHAKNGPGAIAKFRQVVRLDPQNAQGFYSLAVALEAKGDFAEADKCYRKAAEIEPENKDFAQSIKALQKHASTAKQVDGKELELRTLAQDAAKEFQSGQYVSAIDLYKQLEEKKPNDPLTKFNMATIYMALNQPVTALNYFKQAAKLDPKEPRYKEAAQKLEANLNKDEAERQAAEKAWQAKNGNRGSGGPGSGGGQGNYGGGGFQPGAPVNNGDKNNEKKHADKQKPDKGPTFESDPLLFYGLHAKSSKEGVKVVECDANSRAMQVGLKTDDVIVALDGAVVNNVNKMKEMISHKPPGQRFQLTVERNQRVGQILF